MTTHVSKVKVQWHGGFDGRGRVRSPGFDTAFSLPGAFGGANEGASPEDLLLSAIVSCYAATLGIVLNKASVTYASLSVYGELVTGTAIPASIQEVNLVLDIATDTSRERLTALAERVDGFCVVAKALNPSLKKTVRINHRCATTPSPSAEH